MASRCQREPGSRHPLARRARQRLHEFACLEAANRSKSSFLAGAIHDLRQPAHALRLYMAALADHPLGAAERELLARMKTTLGALEQMFDALLDMSRMEAGAVTPQPRPFALDAMLHRLAEEFAVRAARKGLRLSVRMTPATRTRHACSDPVLVERIVRNLLANAVKYTHAGGVLLSCRLRGGAHWRIEVWDTGIGIADDDQQRVFDAFYQAGHSERERAGGLGLGLSIARRSADLLGHRLELVSVPQRGSRFALELPSTDAAAPAGGLHDAPERAPALHEATP